MAVLTVWFRALGACVLLCLLAAFSAAAADLNVCCRFCPDDQFVLEGDYPYFEKILLLDKLQGVDISEKPTVILTSCPEVEYVNFTNHKPSSVVIRAFLQIGGDTIPGATFFYRVLIDGIHHGPEFRHVVRPNGFPQGDDIAVVVPYLEAGRHRIEIDARTEHAGTRLKMTQIFATAQGFPAADYPSAVRDAADDIVLNGDWQSLNTPVSVTVPKAEGLHLYEQAYLQFQNGTPGSPVELRFVVNGVEQPSFTIAVPQLMPEGITVLDHHELKLPPGKYDVVLQGRGAATINTRRVEVVTAPTVSDAGTPLSMIAPSAETPLDAPTPEQPINCFFVGIGTGGRFGTPFCGKYTLLLDETLPEMPRETDDKLFTMFGDGLIEFHNRTGENGVITIGVESIYMNDKSASCLALMNDPPAQPCADRAQCETADFTIVELTIPPGRSQKFFFMDPLNWGTLAPNRVRLWARKRQCDASEAGSITVGQRRLKLQMVPQGFGECYYTPTGEDAFRPPPAINLSLHTDTRAETPRVLLQWQYENPNDLRYGVSKWFVFRADGNSGEFRQVAEVFGFPAAYVDTNVVRGQTYHYFLRPTATYVFPDQSVDVCGAESAKITITVPGGNQSLGFSQHPQDQPVPVYGGTATLNATANTAGEGLRIEWLQRSGTQDAPLQGDNFSIQHTLPSSQLTINPVRQPRSQYFARAFRGTEFADSNIATVTCPCPAPRPRPSRHSAYEGGGRPLALWVEDDNDGVTFDWYRKVGANEPQALASGANIIDTPSQTATYYAVMTRTCGDERSTETSTPVTIEVECTAPAIQTQPADQAANIPTSGTLTLETSVEVSGTGPFFYQWFEVSGSSTSAIAGATSSTYRYTPPLGTASRQTVFVRVHSCSAERFTDSNRVTLSTVSCDVPRIAGFSGGGLLDNPGESIELTVLMDPPASPDNQYSYQWFRGNGQALGGGGNSIWVTTGSQETFYVRVTHTCTASNVTSVITSPKAYVWVYGTCKLPPLYVGQSAASLPSGSPDSVTFTAFCDWRNVRYQWYRGTSGDTRHPVSGDAGKSNQLTTSTLAAYWVRASLECGAVQDSGTLTFSRGTCSPIVITRQPSAQTTAAGQAVTLSADADTTPRTLGFQWYEDVASGTDIAVANGTTPSVSVTPAKSTRYYAAITNTSCGVSTSTQLATVRVATCSTIDVRTWPASVPWVDAGQPAVLTVDARSLNASPLTYQWYAGELGDESGKLEGEMQSTYVTAALNADAKYWVRVTNGTCVADSETILVKVCAPPRIGTNYQRNVNSTVAGQSQWLGISATGTNLTYQWYQGESGDESMPVGRGVDQMRVNPFVTTSYWVKVTGHCGIGGTDVTAVNSDTITVSLCPAITEQPYAAHAEVMFNGTTALTLGANGTQLRYQWYRGPRGDFTASTAIANSNALSIATPPITGTTTFWATVTSGSCAIVSEEVVVRLCTGPAAQWNPMPNGEVTQGHTQTLAVVAVPEAMYTFYKGPAGNATSSQVLSGPTTAYWRDVATTEDATYWIRVQAGPCYADTAGVTVRVCVPEITAQPQPVSPVNPNTEVQLTAGARGGALSYQWYIGAKGVTTTPVTNNATATAATLRVTPSATTTYWARITSSCNRTIDTNAITVKVCEPINLLGASQPIIDRGQSAALTVNLYGTNPISYRWYEGPHGNVAGSSVIGDGSIVSVTPYATTDYWVRVTDACGNVRDAASKVSVRPVIDAHPQSRSITENTPATLTVSVQGAQLAYQWYQGASGVTTTPVGTNAPSYTTPALIAETSYWVRITSGGAFADSDAATITICPGPQVLVTSTQVSGAPVELRVNGSQADMTYTWYRGARGVTTDSAGSGALITVYPTVDTMYWVRQSNGHCSGDSAAVSVVICKPAVTQQPQGTMINPGGSHTLSVTATGNPALTYQWFANGAAISGANSRTYVASPGSTTSYFCRVTNGTGPAATCSVDSAAATVQVCQVPVITTQPANVSVTRGQNATVAVTATGTGLTYQWYVGASGVTTSPIAGAVTASMTGPPHSTVDLWVKVTGTCGSVNSATVRVSVAPVLTAQPASVRITRGTSATFSVTADGTMLSYQWYRADGVAAGTNSAAFTTPSLFADTSYFVRVYSGNAYTDSSTATAFICAAPAVNVNQPSQAAGTAVTLSIANPLSGDTYLWYRGNSGNTSVLVSDSGAATSIVVAPNETTTYWVRARSATCHADSANIVVGVCQPKINAQPQPASITQGQTASLSVAAVGTPPLSYQWYAGASGATSSPVAGGTAATLNINPAATTSYWVRVQAAGNPGCFINSAAATVTVCNPPAITAQPAADPPQNSGTLTGMRVTASGSSLTYQWYQGQPGDTSRPVFSNAALVTFNAYTTEYYWVRVSNGCGSVNSNAVLVSVHPQINAQPQSVQITRNTAATFSISASGTYLTYQWYRGTDFTQPVSGATGSTYTTPALNADTSYFVIVRSGNGSATSSVATATICATPVLSVNNPTQTSGATVTLSVANPVSGETYRWYRGNTGDTSALVADTGTTPAMSIIVSQTTNYWVRATRATCYADSAAATVTICYPRITAQPANASIIEGQSATLSVAATGTAPLTYQWFAGASGNTASPIAGATGATITVAPATTTSYWVRVNGSCPVNSNAATVSVCNTPRITAQPQACSGLPGYGCQLSVAASGSNLTYQWHTGASGDMSRPVNGRTSSTMTLANSATEYYWVRVTNSCGSVNSVSVPLSIKPTIFTQPASVTMSSGSTATFSIGVSGTYLSYQWYRSDGVAVGTNSPAYTTPALTTAYSYYCIVNSGTAQNYSSWASIELCDGPAVQSIDKYPSGSCRVLQANAMDWYGAYTYQWFRGARGDTSNPAGYGASVQVCPTSTTSYWCRVTNENGCYTDSQTINVP
jgi:Ig-like domain CHU_C associated